MQLIEKIARAKLRLEEAQLAHTCLLGSDSDYYGPCRCQAGPVNAKIALALRELEL
jgi:hypothetical protein